MKPEKFRPRMFGNAGPFPDGSQESERRVEKRFHPFASHGGQDILRRHSAFTQRMLRSRRVEGSGLAIRHERAITEGPEARASRALPDTR